MKRWRRSLNETKAAGSRRAFLWPLRKDPLIAGIANPTDRCAISIEDDLEARSISRAVAQEHRFVDLECHRAQQPDIWNPQYGTLTCCDVLAAVFRIGTSARCRAAPNSERRAGGERGKDNCKHDSHRKSLSITSQPTLTGLNGVPRQTRGARLIALMIAVARRVAGSRGSSVPARPGPRILAPKLALAPR
jgi:hypothetical protein